MTSATARHRNPTSKRDRPGVSPKRRSLRGTRIESNRKESVVLAIMPSSCLESIAVGGTESDVVGGLVSEMGLWLPEEDP